MIELQSYSLSLAKKTTEHKIYSKSTIILIQKGDTPIFYKATTIRALIYFHQMRWNYGVIPAIALVTALTGSVVTANGMRWYTTLEIPTWTPSGGTISGIWTTLFVLTAASALIVWNTVPHSNRHFWMIIGVFLVNAALNILWSILFFHLHAIGLACIDAILLGSTIVVLIVFLWDSARKAALLLIPYGVWVAFASYLNAVIWAINP
jgi:translocator protein